MNSDPLETLLLLSSPPAPGSLYSSDAREENIHPIFIFISLSIHRLEDKERERRAMKMCSSNSSRRSSSQSY